MATRVAVVGGGTAGFVAAAHLSRLLPELELVQIVDPRIPAIGVGEGTTPGFRAWLDEVTGASYDVLQREVRVTLKRGIEFENWGRVNQVFNHDFVPTEQVGLHISAPLLVEFLRKYVRGEIIEAHVSALVGSDDGVVVQLEDRPEIAVDVALDARGFPQILGEEHLHLSWIPTNAALVTRAPVLRDIERTRAVARPHGWIFVIGLTQDTAYGYIYGRDSATPEKVGADFDAFLASEGIGAHVPLRRIHFPNFVCKAPFQGRVLKIGNAASFIEPLEATAIAIVLYQLNFLMSWLRAFEMAGGRVANQLVAQLNRQIVELVREVSLFIGWHYAEGSVFDTAFWRGAQSGFRTGLDELTPSAVRERFLEQMEHASRLPVGALASVRTKADLNRLEMEHGGFPEPFGGMSPVGFAQISRGIGEKLLSEHASTRL